MKPEETGCQKPSYRLPPHAALPDLSDDDVWDEYVKQAKARVLETRRTRRRYWLHQLFPWL